MATVYKALQFKEPGIMSMKIALAKLSAAAAGTAVIAGGALHVAEEQVATTDYKSVKDTPALRYVKEDRVVERQVPRTTLRKRRVVRRTVECVPASMAGGTGVGAGEQIIYDARGGSSYDDPDLAAAADACAEYGDGASRTVVAVAPAALPVITRHSPTRQAHSMAVLDTYRLRLCRPFPRRAVRLRVGAPTSTELRISSVPAALTGARERLSVHLSPL